MSRRSWTSSRPAVSVRAAVDVRAQPRPGVPGSAGWVRWSGGLLIGVSVAGFLAAAKPETQRPFVVGLMVAAVLIALSLLYSLFVGGYGGAPWFLWLPIVINAGLAAALAWVASKLA
jgi:hypothetical protein